MTCPRLCGMCHREELVMLHEATAGMCATCQRDAEELEAELDPPELGDIRLLLMEER